MRVVALLIAAGTALVLHSGCRHAQPAPAASPATVAADIDTLAAHALYEFDVACERVAMHQWTTPLCGPLVLVDPESRRAVANRSDPARRFRRVGSVFAGTLEASDPLANTAVDWQGERWAMVMLPVPVDPFNRLRLLGHESFHRIQPAVGVPLTTPLNAHLDERDARLWLRLELRALARAVTAPAESDARAALADALVFRANRNRLYPGTDTLETQLEIGEGTAEYAGIRFAMDALGRPAATVLEWSRARFERTPTFTRSLGYGTGPALGLALDRFAPGWRTRVRGVRSLTAALATSITWPPPADVATTAFTRAAAYGIGELAVEEDARAADRATRLANYRARLVDGPVVMFRQRRLGGAFDPNTIVPLGGAGTVYPRRTFAAEWGTLRVDEGGALVSPDAGQLRVSAFPEPQPREGRTVAGPGWHLELAEGWTLERGARTGDWEVKPKAAAERPPGLT